MTNNLKEEQPLTDDHKLILRIINCFNAERGATVAEVSAVYTLINQKERESEIRALEGLLDSDADEVTCVCESASTEVCDHNWSLCNVVRDRIKQLKEELKGGKDE